MKRSVFAAFTAILAFAFVAPLQAQAAHRDHNRTYQGGSSSRIIHREHRRIQPAPVQRRHVQQGQFSFGITIGTPPRHYRPYGVHPQPYRVYQPRRVYRVAPAPRRFTVGQAHVQWCHARYRSYRSWDNTFQPYHGARRACLSPYGGH